jgi:hypothetical protein
MECFVGSNCCPDIGPLCAILCTMFVVSMVLIAFAIKVLIFCKIFSKAGYSWALGLLILVPFVNIIAAFFLAFADWPIRKELRSLKQQREKPKA